MTDTTTDPPNVNVGDLVRVRKGTYTGLLEVDQIEEGLFVGGRIPYASTYTAGGQYEGAYRGRQTAWVDQVESIERRAAAPAGDTGNGLA